jgi:hypothetical protein
MLYRCQINDLADHAKILNGHTRELAIIKNDVRVVASSFMRMRVGSSRMLVSGLAMFMSRRCVLLSFFVLTQGMVMLGLMMMMCSGVVVSGRQVMMFTRWMLR